MKHTHSGVYSDEGRDSHYKSQRGKLITTDTTMCFPGTSSQVPLDVQLPPARTLPSHGHGQGHTGSEALVDLPRGGGSAPCGVCHADVRRACLWPGPLWEGGRGGCIIVLEMGTVVSLTSWWTHLELGESDSRSTRPGPPSTVGSLSSGSCHCLQPTP